MTPRQAIAVLERYQSPTIPGAQALAPAWAALETASKTLGGAPTLRAAFERMVMAGDLPAIQSWRAAGLDAWLARAGSDLRVEILSAQLNGAPWMGTLDAAGISAWEKEVQAWLAKSRRQNIGVNPANPLPEKVGAAVWRRGGWDAVEELGPVQWRVGSLSLLGRWNAWRNARTPLQLMQEAVRNVCTKPLAFSPEAARRYAEGVWEEWRAHPAGQRKVRYLDVLSALDNEQALERAPTPALEVLGRWFSKAVAVWQQEPLATRKRPHALEHWRQSLVQRCLLVPEQDLAQAQACWTLVNYWDGLAVQEETGGDCKLFEPVQWPALVTLVIARARAVSSVAPSQPTAARASDGRPTAAQVAWAQMASDWEVLFEQTRLSEAIVDSAALPLLQKGLERLPVDWRAVAEQTLPEEWSAGLRAWRLGQALEAGLPTDESHPRPRF